ncbi:MAG TPA: 6-pyruvoyl-tetrahydropterin synthase-related protein [Terriglobales bacterium]|nr:6-pyruvoyl-tetrahydropterin synthase-related protein [Terriglobales bacterium]
MPLTPWLFLLILAAGLAVVLPFLLWGNPSGHDFEFHLNSWIDVLSQWRHGIIYPQWAWQAQWGYGEARFIFYPPASWTLGAFIGALLPWFLVPAVYVWIALTLSGCAMFLLARNWLEMRDAVFAAMLYAVNPYYLLIVYWRSAFAELLAGALFPLLLLYVLRLECDDRRAALALSLIVAAAWLTNIPAAVMLNYSLALLVLVAAWFHRSRRIFLWGVFAVVLGAALAAFFLVPVAAEQKWTQIAQVLSPGVRPQDNFLFTLLADPDHNRFNLSVSLVAAAEMVLLAAAVFYSRRWRSRSPLLWKELVIWALAAGLLMFSITSLAWVFLPKLRFVQLPWRWLLCVNLAFALFVTMAWRRWLMRGLLYGIMLTMVAVVWNRVQPPWWDTKLDIAEMVENQRTWIGYEGTDEYVPVGADPYEVKHDAPLVRFAEPEEGSVKMEKWDPETKLFTAHATRADLLTLRLFNYPAWKVEVNGRIVSAQSKELTGQMLIPIEAGENLVRVTFIRTWDRTLGGAISLIAVVFVLAFPAQQKLGKLGSGSF